MCRMLQDPATLRHGTWYKGKTTTSVTLMKMEYRDEMKLNPQDSLGISLMTLQRSFTLTLLSLLWNLIYRRMIRLPCDTWSLHTDEATTSGCTVPPIAWNRAWMTQGAYSEDNEELRFWFQVCQHKKLAAYYIELAHLTLDVGAKDTWDACSSADGWRPKDSRLYG
jgi:hypothetical protein